MELLQGESLAERLTKGKRPIDHAVSIAQEVLGALQALHSRGFLHRDIKASNIFLASHGVKLLDFGLARLFEHTPSEQTISGATMPGTIVGTPQYMAPEALAAADVTARADLFAVGAVVFEMVSGTSPFGGGSLAEITRADLWRPRAPRSVHCPR